MSYQKQQFELFEKIEADFKEGKSDVTTVSSSHDFLSDNRICLTSVVFIEEKELNKKIISEIVNPMKILDERQYFYLPRSLHLTIQNIRTSNYPPLFSEEDIKKAEEVFNKVIPKHKSFSFKLKGLFELPTSFSIRGYCDEILQDLVLELRRELSLAGVPDNKRYGSEKVFFGNITVCRYTTPPNLDFIKKMQKIKNIDIGELKVKNISLIITNAVCHPDRTKVIGTFNLK